MTALLSKLRDIERRESDAFHTRDNQAIGIGVEDGLTLGEWRQVVHAFADYGPMLEQYLTVKAKHDAMEHRLSWREREVAELTAKINAKPRGFLARLFGSGK